MRKLVEIERMFRNTMTKNEVDAIIPELKSIILEIASVVGDSELCIMNVDDEIVVRVAELVGMTEKEIVKSMYVVFEIDTVRSSVEWVCGKGKYWTSYVLKEIEKN